MFPICCVRDSSLEKLNQKNTEELSTELYEFVFVDGNGCTCQSQTMRSRLLTQAVYDRWIDHGTIHAITHHSFMCITGNNPKYYDGVTATVVNPFLTSYVQLAILVLVQRASIIKLCNDAAFLATGFDGNGKVKREQVEQIRRLQENYVAFQNQLLFFEVTAQEQGVEIYERLQQSLYIHQQIDKLERQLQNLHEIANQDTDRKSNFRLAIIAWLGGGIALAAFLRDLFDFIIRLYNK
jgi:hypothetical protein